MIGRLISTRRPQTLPEDRDGAPETVLAAPPEEIAQFVPMVPLAPPRAVNDDPEGALCDVVEAALRGAGYLREPPVA